MTEVAFPPLDPSSCATVAVVPPPTIIFPGGFSLQGLLALPGGSRQEILSGLISQAQAAMMPEAPILTLVDATTATLQVLTDLAPPPPQLPNPAKAAQDAVKLADAVSKLAAIPPPISAAPFVKSLLQVIVLFLQGIVDELNAIIAQQQRITAALDLSAVADDAQLAADLAAVAACEQGRLDAQIQNQAAAMGPLNTLMGLIQPLLAAIPGLPPIPVFGPLGPDPAAGVAVLEGLADALNAILLVIP